MKIVIAQSNPEITDSMLKIKEILLSHQPDWEVVTYAYQGDVQEFKGLVSDADGIITAYVKLDREIIDAAPKLKAVSYTSTGYNTVDLDHATQKKIAVLAIEEYCTDEVADHTLALLLDLSRGIKTYIKSVDQRKEWNVMAVGTLKRLRGQKMGIFGFGRIGKAVAKRAQAFGIEVVAYDKYLSDKPNELGVQMVDPEYIYENCTIISNHMAQTPENRYFFDREAFGKMKQQPIFINVGRGLAVDQEALIEALDNGQVGGAGLDVLEVEHPDISDCALVGRDNVILTPHAAFYSQESMADIVRIPCENIVNYLTGNYDKLFKIVNPEILG